MKEEKRFQECNLIGKIFRYRWYLCVPFIFIYQRIKYKSEFTARTEWGIIISEMQFKMNWYYTFDEVKEKFKEKFKDKLKEK